MIIDSSFDLCGIVGYHSNLFYDGSLGCGEACAFRIKCLGKYQVVAVFQNVVKCIFVDVVIWFAS